MVAVATVFVSASAVAAADADDADAGIVRAVRPESATLLPIYERQSYDLPRAERNNESRIRQWDHHRHRSPDCHSARPADEYD